MSFTVETLAAPASDDDLQALGALLVDVVNGGASVSFLPPLPLETALSWWREQLVPPDRAQLLVARDRSGPEPSQIVGSVQLHPSWAPNQPHRGDVAKLLVHRRARRRGIGRALMAALEARARAAGLTLLTLDTARGGEGERLYRATGWIEAGSIPGYAIGAGGALFETVFFYKRL
jgi:GNAT superfamily N-acetyltransferase